MKLYAACAFALLVSTTTHAAPVVASGKLVFGSGKEHIEGVLARPLASGKHPAIVLVHEWWGLNDWAKSKANELGKLGYVVLVPDLYRGKVPKDADEAHQLSRGMPQDRALRDLHAAVDALGQEKDVDPRRIAVAGWCMGGGLALELAADEPRLAATIVYYGAIPTDAAKVARVKAPVLGSFGADDKGIPAADVRAFEAALRKQGTSAELKVYPGAGHAFASAIGTDRFRPDAAKDADARTAAFLDKVLHPER